MYDAFEKPIDDEKIQAIVQSWKNQKSGAANNQNTKNKVIDWMGLSCQTCGDAKLAQDLLEQFAKDLPIAEQDIKAAISVNDFKKISFIAIKIKGASLYCHTAQITTLMEDLYQAAQNQNKKLIKEIFKQFKSAIQEVITAVAGYEW
jgi:HPt (histidine-containing phosphotransfer) domain-containing protein